MAGGASDRCVPVGVMLLGEGTATPGEKSGGARMSSKAAKGPPDATEPSRVARCACRDREINPTTESIQTVVRGAGEKALDVPTLQPRDFRRSSRPCL